jgi:hypothetical protein
MMQKANSEPHRDFSLQCLKAVAEILFTGNKADLGPACGTGGSHSSKQYVGRRKCALTQELELSASTPTES